MFRIVTALGSLLALAVLPLASQTITERTRNLDKRDGFYPLYWDAGAGRLLLEIPDFERQFLYLTSLATGIGSNDLGLDRGMIGDERIGRFERVGPRVLFLLENPRFRATNGNPALVRSVTESFPVSTMGAFDIVAEEDGRVLIDATDYFLTDVMNVRAELKEAGNAGVAVDKARSAIHLPRTKAFPRNTEIEASLTFAIDEPSNDIRRHSPDGRAVTLRQHHSMVALPAAGYRPRRFDPRIGVFPIVFNDYAKPFTDDYETRYIVRHRLIKRNPQAARSEPVTPIVYYMDRAIPEPYRTAFRDGAMWWNEVFEAAGFDNAFRVEDMPEDMDPMDARYHVIQWVHRTEAGSSIGPSFVDPRTGEIIKAAVRMDSHRSLVDHDIYSGVMPATDDEPVRDPFLADPGLAAWLAMLDPNVSAEEFSMARRRQHSAHEVGHTLGLAHNFIATSYGRASVMDYPAPFIQVTDGQIDLAAAYRNGPGAYDSVAIRYAYTHFSPEQEASGLDGIVRDAARQGIKFITNPDQASDGAYPEASVWVNGTDMLAELGRVTFVRRTLLDRFDERAVEPGEPMAKLSRRLATVYLHHRYTLDAAIKTVGGMGFRYGLRGDELPVTSVVDAERQRRALDLVLGALEPAELALPERVLQALAPRPFGYATHERAFRSDAGPAFDNLGAARTLATTIVGGLLQRERAHRIATFASRNADHPTLEEVIGRITDRTWGAAPEARYPALRRVVERVVVDALITLASDSRASVEARAGAEWGLRRIADLIQAREATVPAEQAHRALAWSDIERFLQRRDPGTQRTDPLAAPPGTPIGK